MSYSGQDTAPCLIQGLSTSDIQDTWTDARVTFSATNKKAELPAHYNADWCMRLSIDLGSGSTSAWMANLIPYVGASREEHSLIENWLGTTNYVGSEALICVQNYIEYIQDSSPYGSSPIINYTGCSTTCELFL